MEAEQTRSDEDTTASQNFPDVIIFVKVCLKHFAVVILLPMESTQVD
jgi:hypothetical protein